MKNVLLQAVAVVAVTLCMTSHVLAQPVVNDVLPGTTERFDLPDGDFNTPCDPGLTPTFCETEKNLGNGTMGNFVCTKLTKTKSFTNITTLTKRFKVLAGGHAGNVVNARITGSTKWRGTLAVIDWSQLTPAAFGSLGTRADALLRTSLLDVTATDSDMHFEVGNAAIADFSCEPDRTVGLNIPLPLTSDGVDVEFAVGVCEEESADTFSYGVKLIRGHTYEMQMAVTTQATTGATTAILPITLAAASFHSFPAAFSFDEEINIPDIKIGPLKEDLGFLPFKIIDGFGVNIDGVISFSVPSVTIPEIEIDITIPTSVLNDPINAVLETILPEVDNGFVEWDYFTVTIDPDRAAQLSDLSAQLTALADQAAELREGVVESIQLLHTPQGQRTSNYPGACGDGCDFPEK